MSIQVRRISALGRALAAISILTVGPVPANAQSAELALNIAVPSGLCEYDWNRPAADAFLSLLMEREDFHSNMAYMTDRCPQVFCPWDWEEPIKKKAAAELMSEEPYFDELLAKLQTICPANNLEECLFPGSDHDDNGGNGENGGSGENGNGTDDGSEDHDCGHGNNPGKIDPDNPGKGNKN